MKLMLYTMSAINPLVCIVEYISIYTNSTVHPWSQFDPTGSRTLPILTVNTLDPRACNSQADYRLSTVFPLYIYCQILFFHLASFINFHYVFLFYFILFFIAA